MVLPINSVAFQKERKRENVTTNPLHSKISPRWGTPSDIADLARLALGGIDLDPASAEEFNAQIKADRFYTEEENGLFLAWRGRVFLNPPGGRVNEFWEKLIEEYCTGNVTSAIWVGFSVEQLCTLQDARFYPLDFSTVILRKRLKFIPEGAGGAGGKSNPSHGNYITGIGIQKDIFASAFGCLGRVSQGIASIP